MKIYTDGELKDCTELKCIHIIECEHGCIGFRQIEEQEDFADDETINWDGQDPETEPGNTFMRRGKH